MNRQHSALEIRQIVAEKAKGGPLELVAAIKEQTVEILNGRPRGPRVLAQKEAVLGQILSGNDIEVKMARLQTMLRYLLENGSYVPDDVQLRYLVGEGFLKPGDELIDLAAGPGNIVRQWHGQGNSAIGVDLSPSFVEKSELLTLGLIDDDTQNLSGIIDLQRRSNMRIMNGSRNEPTGRRMVTGSLFWDRVSQPAQAGKNIIELAKDRGNFSVGLLLPNNAEDDEPHIPLDLRITYTPENQRIMHKGTVTSDLRDMTEFLEDNSRRLIHVQNMPYTVSTHSGPQEYEHYYILTSAEEK